MPTRPITSGDSEGDMGQKITDPLVRSSKHCWHIISCPALSRHLGFHRSESLGGQQVKSYPRRHQINHARFPVEVRVVCLEVVLPSLLHQIWIFGEGFPLTPFQGLPKGHPVFLFKVGWLFGSPHSFASWLWQGHHWVRWRVPSFGPWRGPRHCQSCSWGNYASGSFPSGAHLGGMFRRVASIMFPMSSWRGAIRTPWASGE